MAKLLERIAAPLLRDVSQAWSCESVKSIYVLAALAWNLSFETKGPVSAYVAGLEQEVQDDVFAMSKRTKALFSDDPRIVLGVEVTRTATGFHAQAVSARKE
jgi:hypothetical protein